MEAGSRFSFRPGFCFIPPPYKQALTDSNQTINVNGAHSEPAKVISGVPQGSALGPILFLIMISDIDKNVNDSTVRSFADDTRIKRITCTNDVTNLQNDLSKICEWTNQNKMTFNENKFELLRYKTKNTNIQDSTSYITAQEKL